MTNLLHDLLPDAPREAGILTAAAQKNVAGMLREHIGQGMDAALAIRLAARSFADSTAFPPEACEWAATELAVATGVLDPREAPAGGPAIAPAGWPEPPDEQPPTAQPSPVPDIPTLAPPAHAAGQRGGQIPDQAMAAAAGSGAARPGGARPRRGGRRAAMVAAGVAVLGAAGVGGYALAGSAYHVGAGGTPGTPHPTSATSPATTAPQDSPSATAPVTGPGSPAPTSPPVTAPASGPDDVWIAQLDSVKQASGIAALNATLAKVRLEIPQARVLDSSSYASLYPCYWVIYYLGSFADGAQAVSYCAEHGRTTSHLCLGRYLSHSYADFYDQCYPPAASPSGDCYHTTADAQRAGAARPPGEA